jgi:hypothetical protein
MQSEDFANGYDKRDDSDDDLEGEEDNGEDAD